MYNIPCPKCGSRATRLEEEDTSLFLKCRCGYYKPMVRTLSSGIIIEHIHIDKEPMLPRKGTKLLRCLGALASRPGASTQEVATFLATVEGVEWSTDEVASFLTILKHRGLCCISVHGKGVTGGSRWQLTALAKGLLHVT